MHNHKQDNIRYSRQTLLNEIGIEGQALLQAKKVAIVGVGALGTVAAELLTRAGIGTLILIDRDIVEESNLQRQTLFHENDVGRSKALAAQEKLQEINSTITVEAYPLHLNAEKMEMLKNVDLILDCTDNLKTRFLINDFCKKEKIPWIYAAAIKTSGYVLPILPTGPCLQCFLSEGNLETCDTVGVLNTITFSIASLQTTIVLQLLLGKMVEPILYHYDIWNQQFQKLKINQKENCPSCLGNYVHLEKKDPAKYIRFCSTGKYQIEGRELDLRQIKERWERVEAVQEDGGITLRCKNILLFKDGRALISAQTEEEAQSIYSKYIGN
jgi:adenylyltransferase/sulfurtransferase